MSKKVTEYEKVGSKRVYPEFDISKHVTTTHEAFHCDCGKTYIISESVKPHDDLPLPPERGASQASN